MTQFLNVCCFSKCYFCEISQGCKSTLLGIPTTTMSCNNSVHYSIYYLICSDVN